MDPKITRRKSSTTYYSHRQNVYNSEGQTGGGLRVEYQQDNNNVNTYYDEGQSHHDDDQSQPLTFNDRPDEANNDEAVSKESKPTLSFQTATRLLRTKQRLMRDLKLKKQGKENDSAQSDSAQQPNTTEFMTQVSDNTALEYNSKNTLRMLRESGSNASSPMAGGVKTKKVAFAKSISYQPEDTFSGMDDVFKDFKLDP